MQSSYTASALILAGGSGTRFGAGYNKALIRLCGDPLFIHSLRAFDAVEGIGRLVLVIDKESFAEVEAILKKYTFNKPVAMICGRETRQDSTIAGLEFLLGLSPVSSGADELPVILDPTVAARPPASPERPVVADPPGSSEPNDPGTEFVLIHDAARCLVSGEIIEANLRVARERGAAITALPVTDTLKQITAEGYLTVGPERSELYAAQTPQCFRLTDIHTAYSTVRASGKTYTDEAAAAEAIGIQVYPSPGSAQNIKITHPEDLLLAEAIRRIK